MKLYQLNDLIAQVCPIHGIDSTGSISFKDEATMQQRAAAEALMTQYLPSINDVEEPDFGTINSKALIRRRATELINSGKQYDALLLLKTIGE